MFKKSGKFKKTAVTALFVIAAFLNACVFHTDSPGGEGSLVITIPGASSQTESIQSRSAILTSAEKDAMRYTITCSGPGGIRAFSAIPGQTITASLIAGRWHIELAAFYIDGSKAGTGSVDVDVTAGEVNVISIPVTVTDEFGTPVIDVHPQSVVYDIGDTPTVLSVTVKPGYGSLTYQWFRNAADNNTDGIAIPGETKSDCMLPASITAASGTLYCYVEITSSFAGTDGAETRKAVSNAATITIGDGGPAPDFSSIDVAAHYQGAYTGVIKLSDLIPSSVTITADQIIGVTTTISNVTTGADTPFDFPLGLGTGTWAYLFEDDVKIGLIYQTTSDSKRYFLGKTLTDTELLLTLASLDGVDTSDMTNTYSGTGSL